MDKKEKLLMLRYYLIEYLLDQINENKKVKEYFENNLIISTFEIDSYFKKDDYEYVQFDLSGQNTGNIFRYKHNVKTDEYIEFDKPLLYSSKVKNTEIPTEILKEIFMLARENSELMKLEKKLIKQINRL